MDKCITERPRVCCHDQRRGERKGYWKQFHKIPADEQPKREGIRKRNPDSKQFTDVLGPLAGYVRKQIGRRFSDVFSEISKVLRPSGMSGHHAQGHLWDMLVTKVVINEEGVACYSDLTYGLGRRNVGLPITFTGGHRDIAYVDPRDGIVKAAPKYKPPKQSRSLPFLVQIDDRRFKQFKGVWYELFMAPVQTFQEPYVNHSTFSKMVMYGTKTVMLGNDLFLGSLGYTSHYTLRNLYGSAELYCTHRLQLNKREIRQLGLRDKKTREDKHRGIYQKE